MKRMELQREALLQEAIEDKARCLTCERRCLLPPGGVGWCRTRKNLNGKIYTLVYGLISSLSANPIEKKPLYHFFPGSTALTAGSWSCNFACPWCQNWEISKSPPRDYSRGYISPEEFVKLTERYRCQGTSISFNEPTLLLEWSLDVFRLARKAGLYNTFVTNGYMTEEALELLIEAGLDAANVDIKGDERAVREYCQAEVEPVWRNCRLLKERGVHLELTTLVIPGVNDDEQVLGSIAARIRKELGEETPWHLTAYYPAYEFQAPPTPTAALEWAYALGKEAGLKFVYLGNVPGHHLEDTYCPSCGSLLIERQGFSITNYRLREQHGGRPCCPDCGATIPIITKLRR
jgi:pyruvate formate lyase activating enzyme